MSSRPVWSIRASSRTGSKATEKPCLKKQTNEKKKGIEHRDTLKEVENKEFVYNQCYEISVASQVFNFLKSFSFEIISVE